MLIYCLTLLCTTLNSVITGLFCCFTLSGRHKIRFLLFFSLFVPVLLVALDWANIAEIAEGHPLRTIIALIENILLLHFFFEDSLVKKLLIFAAGAVLQYLSVFLVAFPLAILDFFDPILVDVELTPEFLVTQYLGMICYFFLMLVTTRFIRNRSAEGNEGWNLLILFMIVQLFLFFTFPVGMGKVIPQEFLVFFIFAALLCFCTDLAIFYVIDGINKKAALEAAAEFYKNQLSMQLSLYENFSAYGESLRQTKQDLVESLSQAQQSLKSRDYSSAEKMLKPLPQELEKLRTISYCEHRIVNALLFVKQRKMKQYGISFDCRVRLAEDCFVESSHLCRILSNLLDNAIEACREIPNAEIHLTCMPVKDTLLMKTENPVSGSIPIQKNGLPASTKKEFGHGKGLASVKEIAQHYNGSLQVQTDSRFFRATVILFPDGRNA